MTTKDFLVDYSLPEIPECNALSKMDFENQVRAAGCPLVIRNAVANWPAVKQAVTSIDAFAELIKQADQGMVFSAYNGSPEIGGRYFYNQDLSGFNFKRANATISQIIDKLLALRHSAHPEGWYVGATSANNLSQAFLQQHQLDLVGNEVQPLIWLGNSSRVAPHFDTSDNLACVLCGTRRFLLFPPEQVSNLYVGPIHHTMAGPSSSLVDPRAIDLNRYPKFADALQSAQTAELLPGDAIYIPSVWWHYVESQGPLTALCNYWWPSKIGSAFMPSLILMLLTMQDAPSAQKRAYHELFKHYIFDKNAHNAAEHLPLQARGPLGEPSAQRDMTIKGFLRNSLPSLLK